MRNPNFLTDNFHARKERTVNIPDDRVLQLTQQILEMVKSMVIMFMFQQARFQSSRLYTDRIMDIASDLVVVLSCSSNLFLSIQLKWGMGGGGGVWLSSLY